MHHIILVLHIAVLGYWLGSELVINSLYRFVCHRDDLPFSARDAMMDHVMVVDQHVRYALVLQLMLGLTLLAGLGLLPVSPWLLLLLGSVWLGFVERVHRRRGHPSGKGFARIDRVSRYILIAALLGAAFLGPLPFWLRVKLGLFAGVMLCGIAIRHALIRHFGIWANMATDGASGGRNAAIKLIYTRATSILALLWLFIVGIVIVSIARPG